MGGAAGAFRPAPCVHAAHAAVAGQRLPAAGRVPGPLASANPKVQPEPPELSAFLSSSGQTQPASPPPGRETGFGAEESGNPCALLPASDLELWALRSPFPPKSGGGRRGSPASVLPPSAEASAQPRRAPPDVLEPGNPRVSFFCAPAGDGDERAAAARGSETGCSPAWGALPQRCSGRGSAGRAGRGGGREDWIR